MYKQLLTFDIAITNKQIIYIGIKPLSNFIYYKYDLCVTLLRKPELYNRNTVLISHLIYFQLSYQEEIFLKVAIGSALWEIINIMI